MPRILMVSKFKEFHGGPERHLYSLMDALADRGYDLDLFASEDVQAAGGATFSASAHGHDKAKAATALMWNASARRLLKQKISSFRPDIVHFHSIYHQLSPSVLGLHRGPTVMTLHDYKLSAPCYSLYRDGDVCRACVGRFVATPAIKFRCISNSSVASALCVTEDLVHRRRYRTLIDKFIVPSHFAFDVAVQGGLPAERISIIPWGVAVHRSQSRYEPGVAFFGGRFLENKGLQVLLNAWRSLPPGHKCRLRIAGRGDLEHAVRGAASIDPTIEFLGMLPGADAVEEVRTAAVAVMPSLVPETMGLAALEALVLGTPLLISRRGALQDLAGPGVWALPDVNEKSVREALVSLLIEGRDSEYREALAHRDLSRYSFTRMVDAIEETYSSAASASGREI